LPDSDTPDQITAALAAFHVQDGDRIRISPILPYAQKSVYLDGHVFRPGKYGYRDGMKISDLLHSYSDLLPEPSQRHAELIRLSAPDFHPTVIAFNVDEALRHDANSDLALQPLDTVRIFGRYDFEDSPQVTVSGEVRKPGVHRTSGELHVRDAVYLAGGLTLDARLDQAQIFRSENGKVSVLSIDLGRALKGDPAFDLALHSRDRLIIHRDLAKADPPAVLVEGEVVKPGKYPLADGMTAGQLVKLAGGFKRGAYTELADLSRYTIENGARIEGQHQQIEIAKAVASPDADVPLRDGDTLTVRQIAGFNDIGSTVSVQGEVMHPSAYGIEQGERLSSLLLRAGGFSPDAYPQGIVLSRASLRDMEERNRTELLKRMQSELAAQKYKPGTSPQDVSTSQEAFFLQEQQIVDRVKNEPAVGRLVVRISPDIAKWRNTPADVELRAGDSILIPKRPTQVMISGQVYDPTAITYVPGKTADWYLRQAGGLNELANKRSLFIVRADGSIVGHGGATDGWWHESVMSTVLRPGDTLVAPERLLGGSQTFKTLLESAQIVSSIAISAKAVGVF
jgi:protein involved in polysaccharide export with SLBB domain